MTAKGWFKRGAVFSRTVNKVRNTCFWAAYLCRNQSKLHTFFSNNEDSTYCMGNHFSRKPEAVIIEIMCGLGMTDDRPNSSSAI